jgi:hypothetical protein
MRIRITFLHDSNFVTDGYGSYRINSLRIRHTVIPGSWHRGWLVPRATAAEVAASGSVNPDSPRNPRYLHRTVHVQYVVACERYI